MTKPKDVTWCNNGSYNFAVMDSDVHGAIGSHVESGVAEIYTVKDAKKLIEFLKKFIAYKKEMHTCK